MVKGKKKGKLKNDKHMKKADKVISPGVTGFITRDRVAKKLQISADQFRQLCIYKGIHPVEPTYKKLRKLGKAKQWYYLKDVNFMNRDEIVQWFRGMHIYKNKKTHLKAVKKPFELEALKKNKPTLDMSHYILERYPSLQHAIDSLDDALSIIYLFAELDANSKIGKVISQKHLKETLRLKAEWQRFIIESKALRKVFCSIKGVYYQAEVMGNTVTWLVPHAGQRIGVPSGVDVLTMSFFAQFYINLLSFVFYKLYTGLGFHYPPKFESTLQNLNESVKAVQLEKILPAKKQASAPKPQKREELTAAERERIAIVNKSLSNIIHIDDETVAKQEEQLMDIKQEPSDEVPEEFIKGNEEAAEDETKVEYAHDTSHLFRGIVFFINREIPKTELQFMIRACGGDDITDYTGDDNDKTITHHIVDREWDRSKMEVTREYIQPQWVFDSINAGILLPYHEYAPDAVLPPHLSPFINDAERGYIPEQREHLDKLIAQRKGDKGEDIKVKPLRDVKEEGDADTDKLIGEDDEDEEEKGALNAWEAQYVKELAAEQEGKTYAGYAQDEQGLTEMLGSDVDEDEVERIRAKARKDASLQKKTEEQAILEKMSMDLLSSKKRKMVKGMKKHVDKIAARNQKLVRRRLAVDKLKKERELKAHQALPAPAPVLGGEKEGKRKATDEQPNNKKAKKSKK